jgi:outer membrane protein assembly factor BamB
MKLPAELRRVWKRQIKGRVSAPVIAGGLVVVSAIDAHRIVALDAKDGSVRWTFMPGGRVDSPPTLHEGLVLFGCADGRVYCVRASDGKEVWRFRAAPEDRRTVAVDQIESLWPVHGSVLVQNGTAYVTAGRSSYLDGGIRVYGLDPKTGKVVGETCIRSDHPGPGTPTKEKPPTDEAPRRIAQNTVDMRTLTAPDKSDSFSMAGGATTDVLVGDGTSVYMRQVRLDSRCARQEKSGRHLLSTTRLLDDAEVHRSHWFLGTGDFSRMPVSYSWIVNPIKARWNVPAAVPYGLLLAFDDEAVWGIRRWKGYTLYAAANKPFSADEAALPDFRPGAKDTMNNATWMWSVTLSMRPRAMLRAGELLFIGGMPVAIPKEGSYEIFEGRDGGVLAAVSPADGKTVAEHKLDRPPVWDGMAAAEGRLYLSTVDGHVVCMGK